MHLRLKSNIVKLYVNDINRLKLLLTTVICIATAYSCTQHTDDNINESSVEVDFSESNDHNATTPDSISALFHSRVLDNYIVDRKILDTLGQDIHYSRYQLFPDRTTLYPYPATIESYEFDNRSISFASDGKFGKIFVNDSTIFTIISLSDSDLSKMPQNPDIGILMKTIDSAKNFPAAKFDEDGIVSTERRKSWIAKFRIYYTYAAIVLEYDDSTSISLLNHKVIPIMESYPSADRKKLIPQAAYKRRPPFLFANWREYAIPFYRHGY